MGAVFHPLNHIEIKRGTRNIFSRDNGRKTKDNAIHEQGNKEREYEKKGWGHYRATILRATIRIKLRHMPTTISNVFLV
ncbi:hypothetical protein [Sulfodiicoccus acidiphilus]|uniref:hypothetical protein n=1 Tax=Sulfodiicoccus acidiphilus TaxID=1670455 RepID=UPI00138FD1BD|nr:hypothetical protein [Sulfodiicoccus acidiphilus]